MSPRPKNATVASPVQTGNVLVFADSALGARRKRTYRVYANVNAGVASGTQLTFVSGLTNCGLVANNATVRGVLWMGGRNM